MRRPCLAAALSLLAACGGSSSAPEIFGGFTPSGGTAIIFPAASCSISGVGTASASGVLLELTDFADACAWSTDIALCGSRASSTFIMVAAVSGDRTGTAPAFGTGTYRVLTAPPTTNAFAGAVGSAVRTDADCALTGVSADASGGAVTITGITATNVTGSLDLTFENGTVYRKPFDLARCDPPADVCTLLPGSTCHPGLPPWKCVGGPL